MTYSDYEELSANPASSGPYMHKGTLNHCFIGYSVQNNCNDSLGTLFWSRKQDQTEMHANNLIPTAR